MHLEPGRLRVHVHGRQPPLAEEHGRQRRRRHARRAGRRRRPEPQLRHELGSRQRGVVRRSRERDLPRHGSGLRAGDQGDEGPLGPRRLRVPEERPHRGRAAPVSAGLPALHAHAGQRHLHRAGGRRRQSGDRRQGLQRGGRGLGDRGQPARRGHLGEPLRSGHLRRAVHHERRHARRRLPRARHPGLHARGLRAARRERLRLRLPGRRGGRAGGVRAPPAVRARPRRVGRRPGEPGLAHGQHARAVLRRRVRVLLRRPAGRRGDGEALAGHRAPALPDQRRQGPHGPDQGGARRREVQQRPGCLLPPPARRGEGHAAGRQRRGVVRGRPQQLRPLHLQGGQRERREGADPLGRELHGPAADAGPGGAALPHVLHRHPRRARRGLRHLRRGRAGQRVAGSPRGAQPLRRRDLVHGRRGADPPARPAGRHRRRAPRRRGADRRPRLPQRGRQAALHGQGGGHAVRQRRGVPQLRVPGAA